LTSLKFKPNFKNLKNGKKTTKRKEDANEKVLRRQRRSLLLSRSGASCQGGKVGETSRLLPKGKRSYGNSLATEYSLSLKVYKKGFIDF
jgi:hypothetical protein